MGCGCGKKSNIVTPPAANAAAHAAVASGNVRMYDVNKSDGSLLASFSSLSHARAEARRVNGTVVPRQSVTEPISV